MFLGSGTHKCVFLTCRQIMESDKKCINVQNMYFYLFFMCFCTGFGLYLHITVWTPYILCVDKGFFVFLAIFSHFWPFLAIFGPFLTILHVCTSTNF